MLDEAISEIGLTREEFENMEWVDYQRRVIYHYKREAFDWDRTRVLASLILNTNVSTVHQKSPTQLIPLWTDKANRKVITEADRDRILEAIRRTEECQKN